MIVAQMTDIHLSEASAAGGGEASAKALERAVEHICSLDPQPDLVIVTGDIAENGGVAEYERFVTLMKPIEIPVYLVPGNHDRRDAMQAAFRNSRCWPSQSFSPSPYWNYVLDHHQLRFVGLDTLVEGQAHGQLSQESLLWLDEVLAEASERQTLLFMHHPPFTTGIEPMDKVGLRQPELLEQILTRHRQVAKIVCGHVHRPVFGLFANRSISIGPSPARSVALNLEAGGKFELVDEPPALHLHCWTAEMGFVTHQSYIGYSRASD